MMCSNLREDLRLAAPDVLEPELLEARDLLRRDLVEVPAHAREEAHNLQRSEIQRHAHYTVIALSLALQERPPKAKQK